MKTKSTLVTSNWGDEHMFFRHQRMDDDLKIRPEWEPYTPNPSVFGMANKQHEDKLVKAASYACPFLSLFY